MDAPPVTPDDVRAAARRLDGVAHRTPVLTSRTLDARAGARRVLLKGEHLQRVGAFKFRGAYNAMAQLDGTARRRGVATASSGNHAQAVALAGRLLDIPVTVLMPEDAPAGKRAATEGYGAEVVTYDRYAQDREQELDALVEGTGRVPVHPYEDPGVMAGQGTVALELLEQADGPLDVLVVCVGGGGLIAGCATWGRAALPDLRVIGVEPEAGDDTRRSLAAGRRVSVPVPRTIADGQAVPMPGRRTFEVTRRLVEEVVTVSDAEIVAAMAFAFQRMKLVLEPSGASGLAAVLAGRVPGLRGARVGVTLSGGNVDPGRFAALVAPSPEPA